MDRHLASNLAILEARGMLILPDPRGHRIDCIDGTLWITQDRDRRDVLLTDGETFVFDRPGRAIVQALGSGAALALGPGLVADRPAAAPRHRMSALFPHQSWRHGLRAD